LNNENSEIENVEISLSVPCATAFPFVKVPKHDIRRCYVDMFANITNSVDMHMYESFFKQFALPTLKFELTSASHGTQINKPLPSCIQLTGLDTFLQYWFNQLHFVPDLCSKFTNARVVSLAETLQSRVECDFELEFTWVYDLPFDILVSAVGDSGGDMSDEQQPDEDGGIETTISNAPSKKRKLIQFDSSNSTNNRTIKSKQSTSNKASQNRRQFLASQMRCLKSVRAVNAYTLNTPHTQYDLSVKHSIESARLLDRPVEMKIRGVIVMLLDRNKAITGLRWQANEEGGVSL
jgi:hypothetical protein